MLINKSKHKSFHQDINKAYNQLELNDQNQKAADMYI